MKCPGLKPKSNRARFQGHKCPCSLRDDKGRRGNSFFRIQLAEESRCLRPAWSLRRLPCRPWGCDDRSRSFREEFQP